MKRKFINYLSLKKSQKILYSCEPKIDGISASLFYKDGEFIQGLSRGDGIQGENITDNLSTIKDIPKKLSGNDFPDEIDIRGEVFINNSDFEKLKNKFAKNIVLNALKSTKVIFVRESTSFDFLKNLGIDVFKSPDLGFYLKPSKRDFKKYLNERGILIGKKKCVAITLRPYRFDGKKNANDLFDNYLKQIKNLIEDLLSNDINVTLMAHTIGPSAHENDSIALLEVFKS